MMLSKRKRLQLTELLSGVLDVRDDKVFIVCRNDCSIVFLNEAAGELLGGSSFRHLDCKLALAEFSPALCEKCQKLDDAYIEGEERADEALSPPFSFDVQDYAGRTYHAAGRSLTWIDGRNAIVYSLRNVHKERDIEKRLYTLAYMDQLTGMSNRQRFKEDFEAQAEKISAGSVVGIVAIFDLDNFKAVNDTYGHNTGDIMLRRIAERLNSESDFAGHVYRLGGDEFVLFYAESKKEFDGLAGLRHYFKELLKKAMRSYTLPNIELSCTLSMGVSFFPQHGVSSSELLRKADIALYKSKSAGRDTCTFFEDKYDTAKKLKDLYINIQPILTALGRTFGYELIDRGNEGVENERSVSLTDFDRTLDALGLDDMQNNSHYFISCNANLHNEQVRSNLPKDKFIIQINLQPTIHEADLKSYAKLRAYGYSLAMNGLTSGNATSALIELMDYGKFAPHGMTELMQDKMIVRYPNKTFIALHVDTHAQYEEAKRRGFKLYQGYFFNKPAVTKKTKEIDPLKINYYRLLKLSSTDGHVDFKEISAIISVDVALSYKLLTLLNSAALGLRHRISSIDMAVAYLGEEKLKQWIALLALRGVASDKPLELLRMCLVRAQFGELLAPHFRPRRDVKHVFMTGMFSLLHIALDKTREELMDELPVSEDIRDSLLTRNGPYSDLLQFFSNFEYANWDEITRFADENQISCELINDAYIKAVKWYNDLLE
ncbi:diguanylate cyclase [Christensenellaceae bacterium OttesenSCG-928-M15]|nr:diguanylate cyclase [Christensenellaceae bacterium OttesenSCG-928-M15]